MENLKLIITAHRNGYSPKQCGKTLTVSELIEVLQNYDEDLPVYLSHDNGYTFGSISENDLNEDDEEEGEE
jgi:hypothetical protein